MFPLWEKLIPSGDVQNGFFRNENGRKESALSAVKMKNLKSWTFHWKETYRYRNVHVQNVKAIFFILNTSSKMPAFHFLFRKPILWFQVDRCHHRRDRNAIEVDKGGPRYFDGMSAPSFFLRCLLSERYRREIRRESVSYRGFLIHCTRRNARGVSSRCVISLRLTCRKMLWNVPRCSGSIRQTPFEADSARVHHHPRCFGDLQGRRDKRGVKMDTCELFSN